MNKLSFIFLDGEIHIMQQNTKICVCLDTIYLQTFPCLDPGKSVSENIYIRQSGLRNSTEKIIKNNFSKTKKGR